MRTIGMALRCTGVTPDEQTSLSWLRETGFDVLWQEFMPESNGGHRIVLAQRSS